MGSTWMRRRGGRRTRLAGATLALTASVGFGTIAGCADFGSRDTRCTPDAPNRNASEDCLFDDVSDDEIELCIPTREVAESEPTFAEVFDILVRDDVGCDSAVCHGGVANGNFRINQGEVEAAYESLTTSRGTGKSNFYVVPGDPEASWMHCNVRPEGSEGIIGQVMPQFTGLTDEDARVIEDWILNGAPGP